MSKFNKRIDEMLVVLNAVKKPKKDKEESEVKVDPVTDLMNDTLGRFGVNVSSDKPEDDSDSKEDNEDPIEGSLDELGDLDLPRPADDSGEGEEGEDHSPDFDFMNVGSPTDVKPTDDTNFKDADDLDDGGEGKIRFEYQPGKGVVIGIGGEEAVLSKEQIDTVKQFLSTLPDDFDGEEEAETPDNESEDDDSDTDSEDKDSEDDDDEDKDGFSEARFDGPNPTSKKCKCGGTMTYDKHNQQYKCPKCHAWERGKSSL